MSSLRKFKHSFSKETSKKEFKRFLLGSLRMDLTSSILRLQSAAAERWSTMGFG